MTKDLENRIKEHNAGKTKFPKGHRPWELIYKEEADDFEAGRKREKYLKSSTGKKWLRKQGFID
jgi:predicted GIY-YIG superfamily endonuclease